LPWQRPWWRPCRSGRCGRARKAAELFQPGNHGTTFGGTPLACRAALATLDVIEREATAGARHKVSVAWHEALGRLAFEFSQHIAAVRDAFFW